MLPFQLPLRSINRSRASINPPLHAATHRYSASTIAATHRYAPVRDPKDVAVTRRYAPSQSLNNSASSREPLPTVASLKDGLALGGLRSRSKTLSNICSLNASCDPLPRRG